MSGLQDYGSLLEAVRLCTLNTVIHGVTELWFIISRPSMTAPPRDRPLCCMPPRELNVS